MPDVSTSKAPLSDEFVCQNGRAPYEKNSLAYDDDARVCQMQLSQSSAEPGEMLSPGSDAAPAVDVPDMPDSPQKEPDKSAMELEAPPGKRTSQAYLVAASRFLCYFCRGQCGVLLPVLALELEISSAERGRLMSQYATGYIATQILGGIAADVVGGYPVMAVAMLVSAAACMLAPQLAAAHRLGEALLLLGLAQGAVMPAGAVVNAKWVLPSERAWASSISAIGAAAGTFTVNACAPLLARWCGWPAVFHTSGILCIVFVLVCLRFGISSPSSSCVSVEEANALDSCGMLDVKSAGKKAVLPPAYFFAKMSVWALFVAHFSQNWQAGFSEWMPILYSSRLGVGPEFAGLHLAAIALVELPARALTKDVPKYLLDRGWPLLTCRKWMSVQGFGLHTVTMLFLAALMVLRTHVDFSPIFFTIVLCFGKVSQSMHAGGYFANYFDLTRKYAGALTGVGNTLATLAGLIFPLLASGRVDAELGWVHLIAMVVAMNVIAIIAISQGLSVDCLDVDPGTSLAEAEASAAKPSQDLRRRRQAGKALA